MNRRRFLASVTALLTVPSVVRANGDDDDIDIPVEDCPCCCTDDGIIWYSCDALGNELDGDPANCNEGGATDGTEPEIDVDTDVTEPDTSGDDVDEIVQLPTTGSGPQWDISRYRAR